MSRRALIPGCSQFTAHWTRATPFQPSYRVLFKDMVDGSQIVRAGPKMKEGAHLQHVEQELSCL